MKKSEDTQMLLDLQKVQIEILQVIDEICRKNRIPYSLYAGTLLGAVRHQGFIPWDDDLDICMPRESYQKFIQIWEKQAPPGYILQNKNTDPHFTQSFTKIRKDHTTFLQEEWECGRYHTGIFVDVFPVDRIPKGRFPKMLFMWRCMRYQLYMREFVPPRSSVFVRFGAQMILWMIPCARREKKRKELQKKLTKRNSNSMLECVMLETIQSAKQSYCSDLFENLIEIRFEGGQYLCFEKWNHYLSKKYGDYMQLPPEEDRIWKHHPLIIDFEHSYDELDDSAKKGINI